VRGPSPSRLLPICPFGALTQDLGGASRFVRNRDWSWGTLIPFSGFSLL